MQDYYTHNAKKIGVLLINLGTPDAPTTKDVRRYLKEFLSDKRVIEVPYLLWQIILRCVILPIRSKKSAANYDKIWDKEHQQSPLLVQTQLLAQKTQNRYKKDHVIIDFAMRYGTPSIHKKMEHLHAQNCSKILIFPLYPQYSAPTTASVVDKVFEVMQKKRFQPSLRFVPPYFDDTVYIDKICASIQEKTQEQSYDKMVILFHGLPKKYFDKGDPYFCYCSKTARLIKEKITMDDDNIIMAFQSRFGPQEWLQPYADETIKTLAKTTRKILVVSPGFAVDCIETLEEICMGLRDDYLENGGEEFTYVSCLNASDHACDLMEHIINNELQGWISHE